MNVRIKDLPVEDRPRERLLHYGVEALSNEELLAILLKTGTKQTSAKIVASQLLNQFGSLTEMKKATVATLEKVPGIGPTKASVLLAALELGKRLQKRHVTLYQRKINSSDLVYEYYHDLLMDKKQEYFYCLYLDHSKHVISDRLLFMGTLNQSLVHPREIFKEAYLLSASSIICVHNHPTGNIVPSEEDRVLTKRLVEISHLLGVPIIDHLIIGTTSYYSFFENHEI